MRIGFLITARLKSSRLKLKLLKSLNGYSVIERVIHRAKKVLECDDVILCTSTNNQDLPLVRVALKNNIYYFTGPEDDVLQRLQDAANFFNIDYIIGMTADNPLFSVRYANLLSDIIRTEPDLDYVYTTGLPVGVNIYAIKTKALKVVCRVKEEIDTEIWGPLINRPEIFTVRSVEVAEEDMLDLPRMTLDEQADYDFMHNVFGRFDKDYLIEERDIRKLLGEEPTLIKINAHVVQAQLDDVVEKRIVKFYSDNKERILEIKEKIYSQDN